MPIITPNGVVIRRVVVCIPASTAAAVPNIEWLFGDEVRLQPRLVARPGSDPDALVDAQPGRPPRCAGGPRQLIDLEHTRRRAARVALNRYRHWRSRPDAVDLRRWERILLEHGRDTYVEYHRLRATAGDALIILGDHGARYCPTDTTLEARREYACAVDRRLDALASDALVLTATV